MEDDNPKDTIRGWWASNPMTYGITHGGTEYKSGHEKSTSYELGTREFFETADQRFYGWNTPLHTPQDKFGNLFDYRQFQGKQVLELGCGMGCMAMNWAKKGADVTAVDLNPVAVAQTRRRFEIYGLTGNILEMDAENLNFQEGSFDFAYSWGVLHHSPNLKNALDEIFRVLKPGGATGVMLYNRDSFLYRYTIRTLEGYLHMENEFLNPLELASRYSDGGREEGNPYTWPVTKEEIGDLFNKFKEIRIKVLGTDIEYVLDLALPRLGSWIFPRKLSRALGRRWGWSLWITAKKA